MFEIDGLNVYNDPTYGASFRKLGRTTSTEITDRWANMVHRMLRRFLTDSGQALAADEAAEKAGRDYAGLSLGVAVNAEIPVELWGVGDDPLVTGITMKYAILPIPQLAVLTIPKVGQNFPSSPPNPGVLSLRGAAGASLPAELIPEGVSADHFYDIPAMLSLASGVAPGWFTWGSGSALDGFLWLHWAGAPSTGHYGTRQQSITYSLKEPGNQPAG